MKKLYFIFLSSVSLLWSCDSGTNTPITCTDTGLQNNLIQNTIELSYEQPLEYPESHWFMKSIDRKDFLSKLYAKSANNQIKVYTPLSKVPLTPQETQEVFVGIPDGKAPVSPVEIKSIIFNEEWVLDTSKWMMEKKILGYTLVREFMRTNRDGEQELTKQLVASYDFSQNLPKDYSRLKLLEKNVAYEVPIYNSSMPEWYEKMPSKHVVNVIMDKLLDSTLTGYSFWNRDSLVPKSISDMRLNLGEETIVDYEYDEETGEESEVKYQQEIDYSEIVSFVFIEDWYLDEETMQIYKDVKGIAPVREYTKQLQNGDFDEGRAIPFYTFFSNHKPQQ